MCHSAVRLCAAPKATTNLSEKALHWCDAAKTVGPITAADGRVDAPTNGGWHTENAFDTLAAQGAVAAGCFGEQPGVMYSSDLVGTLGGQCMLKTGLLKCSRTKAFAKKSWTPATAADIIEIQNHIMENRAVATYLNVSGAVNPQPAVGWGTGKEGLFHCFTCLLGQGALRRAVRNGAAMPFHEVRHRPTAELPQSQLAASNGVAAVVGVGVC